MQRAQNNITADFASDSGPYLGCICVYEKIFSSGLVEEERRIKEPCLKVWVVGYKIQMLCSNFGQFGVWCVCVFFNFLFLEPKKVKVH